MRVSEGETGTGSGRTGVEVQWTAKVRLVLDASGSLPGATELPAAPPRAPETRATHTLSEGRFGPTLTASDRGVRTGGQGSSAV